MWGKSKKKLASVQSLIDTANKDIQDRESELAKLNAEIETTDQDTKHIQEQLDSEKKEQASVEAENAELQREIDEANAEVALLKKQTDESKRLSEEAKAEKAKLIKELGVYEELVRKEHTAAEAAAAAARKEAANLLADQEVERKKWQAVRNAHEELRKQVEDSTRQCEEAKSARDRAKEEWTTTRDELKALQLSHGILTEEYKKSEALLVEQQEQRKKLEKDLAALEEQHRQIVSSTKALEDDHKHRQFVLQSVSQNLDDKRGQLQRELSDFQNQFQKAKLQHEQIAVEQGQVRDNMNGFLPEYFQLQTDQAAKSRELEQAVRDSELLNWEHHKVHRDLQMLSNSYDVGFLPQLPPTGGQR